jgi:hypothetical protein
MRQLRVCGEMTAVHELSDLMAKYLPHISTIWFQNAINAKSKISELTILHDVALIKYYKSAKL